MLKFMIIAIIYCVSWASFGQVLTFDAPKTHVIDGGIDGRVVKVAKEIDKTKGSIFLLIDSPGGSVLHGNILIQSMMNAKAQGRKIYCMVTNFAASMAFLIYNECTHRYAMSNTMLLWHPPRVFIMMGIMTAESAKKLQEQLGALERFYDKRILKHLSIDKKLYYKYSRDEFLHFASDLKKIDKRYLRIVDGFKLRKKKK